jgi:hypothetical protein
MLKSKKQQGKAQQPNIIQATSAARENLYYMFPLSKNFSMPNISSFHFQRNGETRILVQPKSVSVIVLIHVISRI